MVFKHPCPNLRMTGKQVPRPSEKVLATAAHGQPQWKRTSQIADTTMAKRRKIAKKNTSVNRDPSLDLPDTTGTPPSPHHAQEVVDMTGDGSDSSDKELQASEDELRE